RSQELLRIVELARFDEADGFVEEPRGDRRMEAEQASEIDFAGAERADQTDEVIGRIVHFLRAYNAAEGGPDLPPVLRASNVAPDERPITTSNEGRAPQSSGHLKRGRPNDGDQATSWPPSFGRMTFASFALLACMELLSLG